MCVRMCVCVCGGGGGGSNHVSHIGSPQDMVGWAGLGWGGGGGGGGGGESD